MDKSYRRELSKNNKYWISKFRRKELEYFCLQYDELCELYKMFDVFKPNVIKDICVNAGMSQESFVENQAIKKAEIKSKINLIDSICMEADNYIYEFIKLHVTKQKSFIELQTVYNIPCGKDMFYDRLQKFFWLLDKKKE